MRYCLLLVVFFLSKSLSLAQSPSDAEFMPKGNICIAAMYGHDSWNKYWESTLFRENGNIGTLTKKSISPMIAYGLNDDIVIAASLPFIDASASQGSLIGINGFQDVGLSMKAKVIKKSTGSFDFSTIIIVGGSIPVSNYNEDYGPLSLGLGSNEVNGRLMLEFVHKSGIYLRPQLSYHHRTVATLERTYYYSDKGYYSDKIDVPDMSLGSIVLGARLFNKKLRMEAAYNRMNTIGGTEIRRNEAPLASGNMDAQSFNFFIQIYPSFLKNAGIIISGGKAIKGQNVGKSTFYSFGFTYQFGLIKKSTDVI
jgi:hypothetical protein